MDIDYIIGPLVILLILFLIILDLVKRQKLKRKIIAESMKGGKVNVVLSLIILLILLAQLIGTIKYFNIMIKDTYICKYISNYHYLLNYPYIVKMEIYFDKMDMFHEYGVIEEYRRCLTSFIMYLVIFIYTLFLGAEKNLICEEGIYIAPKTCKWNNITNYQWADLNITVTKQNKRYIALYFSYTESKLFKFFDEITTEIKFEILFDDKEKVDSFLKKVLEGKQLV